MAFLTKWQREKVAAVGGRKPICLKLYLNVYMVMYAFCIVAFIPVSYILSFHFVCSK